MMKAIGKYIFLLLLLLGGCNADLYSKKWAKTNLEGKEAIAAVKGFMELGYLENRGMVFGFLNNKNNLMQKNFLLGLRILILIAVTIIVIVKRRKSFLFLLPLIIIMAGAGGNIFDQFAYKYVIDFIHIHGGNLIEWPFYFNLADTYICIGIGLLILNPPGQKPHTSPAK